MSNVSDHEGSNSQPRISDKSPKKTLYSEKFAENINNIDDIDKNNILKQEKIIKWKLSLTNSTSMDIYTSKKTLKIQQLTTQLTLLNNNHTTLENMLKTLSQCKITEMDVVLKILNDNLLTNKQEIVDLKNQFKYYESLPHFLSRINIFFRQELVVKNIISEIKEKIISETKIKMLPNQNESDLKYDTNLTDMKHEIEIKTSYYRNSLKTIQSNIEQYKRTFDVVECFHCNLDGIITPSDICEFCDKPMNNLA